VRCVGERWEGKPGKELCIPHSKSGQHLIVTGQTQPEFHFRKVLERLPREFKQDKTCSRESETGAVGLVQLPRKETMSLPEREWGQGPGPQKCQKGRVGHDQLAMSCWAGEELSSHSKLISN
jgi:hypothetical protein